MPRHAFPFRVAVAIVATAPARGLALAQGF
jgi:hypothetical protein